MSKIILSFLIVFISRFETQWVFAENLQCQKVDFNRPTSVVPEFDVCVGSIPVLKINSYADTTIQPFRPDSEFHLTTTDNGLSCLQSTSVFTLDVNSEIATSIYLNMVTVGAWVEVQVFDRDDGEVMVMALLEESSDWILFSGKVNRTIEHAQVEIRAYMNTGSVLAIEFIYVLNSDSVDEECVNETFETNPPTADPVPTTDPNPTTDPTPTTDPNPTTDTTIDPTTDSTNPTIDPSEDPTEGPSETTTENQSGTETTIETTHPTNPPFLSPLSDDYVWIILTILFIVTTTLSLVGLVYFILLYCRVMPVRSKLVPIDDKAVKNLPRLTVKNSVYGEHVIVGIEPVNEKGHTNKS